MNKLPSLTDIVKDNIERLLFNEGMLSTIEKSKIKMLHKFIHRDYFSKGRDPHTLSCGVKQATREYLESAGYRAMIPRKVLDTNTRKYVIAPGEKEFHYKYTK